MTLRQEMSVSAQPKDLDPVAKKSERTYTKLLEKFQACTQHHKNIEKKIDLEAAINTESEEVQKNYLKWTKKFSSLDDESEFQKFMELSSDDKFEFLTTMIKDRRLWEYHFGAVGSILPDDARKNHQLLLNMLEEKQRIELAKFEMSYNGVRILDQYHLSETQNKELKAYAQTQLKQFLPVVTDEMITQCIKENDREELQFLINTRFYGRGLYRRTTLSSYQNLNKLFHDPTSSLQSLADAFKITMQEQEQEYLKVGWLEIARPTPKRYPWSKDENQVSFAHRGGYFNCLRFFSGDATAAYPLNQGGYGIQVLTNVADSHSIYSDKAKGYFDFPASATGRINGTHLDKAAEGAGFRFEHAALATDVNVRKLT